MADPLLSDVVDMQILEPDQVLWFISKEHEQEAEVVDKVTTSSPASPPSTWLSLSRQDCLLLELQHRNLRKSDDPISLAKPSASSPTVSQQSQPKEMVPIRNDMFDVDVERRLAFAVYYHQKPPRRIIRGTWFKVLGAKRLEPISERQSFEVETVFHTKPWVGRDPGSPFRLDLSEGNQFVYFFEDGKGRIYDNSISSRLFQMMQLKSAGYELKRGGRSLESEQEKAQRLDDEQAANRVNHLVMVVHGIGQRMERADINIDVDDLDLLVKKFGRVLFKDDYLNGGIQFLPVQWRTTLDLKCEAHVDVSDSSSDFVTINEVTLKDVATVRSLLNNTVVDVLLFMTPQHRDKILSTVVKEMNRMYNLFVTRNPQFLQRNGRVSILGHSLGSIISFDILCHVNPVSFSSLAAEDAVDDADDELQALKLQMREIELRIQQRKRRLESMRGESVVSVDKDTSLPMLQFNVDQFFAMGSPIGIFLSVRGTRLAEYKRQANPSANIVFPAVRKMFNIFHPSDPVAYRIEPFLDRSLGAKPPEYLPRASGKLPHIVIQESITRNVQSSIDSVNRFFSGFGRRPSTSMTLKAETEKLQKSKSSKEISIASTIPTNTATDLVQLCDGRMDYMIQTVMISAPDVFAVSTGVHSHVTYWTMDDVAYFLAHKLLEKPFS